ncbi:MAG: TonB-dependent receptor [Acidobacteriota bacterium]|nr:TonB-dependent receptor [Acidobacteriota bacterium]
MEAIIVTAEKRETNTQKTPVTLTALGPAALERGRVRDAHDLQYLVPSLSFSQFYRNGRMSLRGVGNNILTIGADPGLVFYVDGVYMSRSQFMTTSFFDLERIEVLRGPQGTLYGRNAVGGVINLIPKKPTADREILLEGKAGNYEDLRIQAVAGGSLWENRILGRLAVTTHEHRGYTPNPALDTDYDDADSNSARGQLHFLISEHVDLGLRFDYHREDGRGPAGIGSRYTPDRVLPGEENGGTLAEGRAVFHDTPNDQKRTFTSLSGTLNWDLGSTSMKLISAVNDYSERLLVDIDYTEFFFADLDWEQEGESMTHELLFFSNSAKRFQWTIGTFFLQEDIEAAQDAAFPTFGALLKNRGRLETEAYALFGQLSYQWEQGWRLTLGSRFSHDRKHVVESQVFDPLTPLVDQELSQSWEAHTPKLTLDYGPNAETLLYLTLARGFKSGGFNVLAVQDRPFEPETIFNVEIGLKKQLSQQGLWINLAAFHSDYSDMQVTQLGEITTIVNNAAKAEITGLEAESYYRSQRGTEVNLSAFYLDARIGEFSTRDDARPDLGVLDLAGNRISRTPERGANLGGQHRFSLGPAGTFTVRGEYSWKSEVFFSLFNVSQAYQPGVGVVNGFLTYDRAPSGLKISLFGKNLTDELIVEDVVVGAQVIGSPPARFYAPPRTYGLSLQYQF